MAADSSSDDRARQQKKHNKIPQKGGDDTQSVTAAAYADRHVWQDEYVDAPAMFGSTPLGAEPTSDGSITTIGSLEAASIGQKATHGLPRSLQSSKKFRIGHRSQRFWSPVHAYLRRFGLEPSSKGLLNCLCLEPGVPNSIRSSASTTHSDTRKRVPSSQTLLHSLCLGRGGAAANAPIGKFLNFNPRNDSARKDQGWQPLQRTTTQPFATISCEGRRNAHTKESFFCLDNHEEPLRSILANILSEA